MIWLYYCILLILLCGGLLLTLVTLPGNWLILAASALFALVTRGMYISWITLLILLLMAIMGEVVELSAGGVAAKRSGATRRGIVGAAIGGILGGIVLSFFIPIPILGTLIGICLGTFVGVVGAETWGGTGVRASATIGLAAVRGRITGGVLKFLIGLTMCLIGAIMALPLHGRTF